MTQEPILTTQTGPLLSIVIRTRNEERNLENVFDALAAQRCSFEWEAIVVDNESEDGTAGLCASRGARVVSITRREFSYGRALNLGIGCARGEFVLILSAHALPIGSRFLQSCVEAFTDDRVAAVRCMGVMDRAKLLQWYRPSNIQYRSLEEQRRAESSRQWTRDYPAATCCVIRRSVWKQVKYDEALEAVEDKLWASQVLSEGFKIACCSEAVYARLDNLNRRELWRKQARELRELHRLRGYTPMSWADFAVTVIKAGIAAPVVAIRFFADSLARNIGLVLVPWRAGAPRRSGSLSRFERDSRKR
ncbi:MAG TPA: glycosyltransferase family 2 protein [Blastocatellia bacterium]|nr:glycosyltransferase family 2 protein [Blastocatellia bacterium]